METEKASLETRVRRLEDLEALRDLMARYATATNKGWNGKTIDAEQMPLIFAAGAMWQGPHERVDGIKNIIASLHRATAAVEFSTHVFSNPVLTLDGDVASGKFLLAIVSKRDGSGRQGQASEDVTFVRTAAGWRIQSLRVYPGRFFSLSEEIA